MVVLPLLTFLQSPRRLGLAQTTKCSRQYNHQAHAATLDYALPPYVGADTPVKLCPTTTQLTKSRTGKPPRLFALVPRYEYRTRRADFAPP